MLPVCLHRLRQVLFWLSVSLWTLDSTQGKAINLTRENSAAHDSSYIFGFLMIDMQDQEVIAVRAEHNLATNMKNGWEVFRFEWMWESRHWYVGEQKLIWTLNFLTSCTHDLQNNVSDCHNWLHDSSSTITCEALASRLWQQSLGSVLNLNKLHIRYSL